MNLIDIAIKIAQTCLVTLLMSMSAAGAAGIASVTVPAAGEDAALTVWVWTPCSRPADSLQMGPYTVQATPGCAPAGQGLPLIAISHGKGGSSMGHYDTATALANAGAVVVSLSHPGDSFGNDEATDRLTVFESRPRDISRAITYMTQNWQYRQQIEASKIGVFGFSRGGATALSLIGGVPDMAASSARFCSAWWTIAISMCRQLKNDGTVVRGMLDQRIRAAVVADPLNLFGPASFKSVKVPVQLWASELGGDGVELSHVTSIKSQLPQPPDFHVARKAGHFAYLSPCPAELKQSAKEICTDPQGFDRAEWHRKMNADVVDFFKRQLAW